MRLKKRKIIYTILFLVGLNLIAIPAQFCSWTFDYNQLHVSNVTSTNDQGVLLISINDNRNETRTIAYNRTDKSFLEPSSFNEKHFDLLDGFSYSKNNYNVKFDTNYNNETILIISSVLENNSFIKTITQTLTKISLFFISERLNMLYVISNTTNYPPEKYVLLVTKMDNSTTVKYIDFSFTGTFWENFDTSWYVNEEEQLFYRSPGCCYCGLGDYFSFNENGLYHVFSADSVAKYTLFDPRVKEFLVVTFLGNVTIYNYEKKTISKFNIDLQSIDNFLSKSQSTNSLSSKSQITTTYFEGLIPSLIFFSLMVINKRRRRREV